MKFKLYILLLIFFYSCSYVNAAYFQAATYLYSSCTTNGSDGFSGAPSSSSSQYPSLLANYATSPNWCVAGVGYAVGITPNATSSGSTITEINNQNIPVNNDKKSFYARSGGSLPSGITEGVAYFLCNVTNTTGNTYTYTLSTTTACGSPITLTGSPPSFIALKIPNFTTNTPSNTTGWNGSANCLTYAFTICINGNNATLDHWDFSNGGGWLITFDTSLRTNPTITNNYFKVGTRGLGFIQDTGQDPSNYTISNNIFDGNAIPITTTSASTVGSGNSTITVTDASNIFDGMTVCDITNDAAINCANDTNSTTITISGTTVSLKNATTGASKNTTGTVNTGDTLKFLYVPGVGGSFYKSPQISINDRGTSTFQYNWVKNTFSEHWQQSISPGTGGVASTGISFKYNLFENSGWGSNVTGAHGDVVQLYCGTVGGTGANCSFQSITLDYNTIIQNNVNAAVTTTTFSILFSGTYGGTATTGNIRNNTALYPAASVTSTFGITALNTSWFSSAVNIQNNYIDPTSACNGAGSGCGTANWANVAPGNGGGTGPSSPTCSSTGNVNLKTGLALPVAPGGYC